MDRRSFLRTAAIAGVAVVGAGALSGCGKKADAGAIEWDRETDVLVIGGGGTGLAAACEAVDNGVKCLVLEKAEEAGGTTALSGGVVQAAGTDEQKKLTKYKNDTPAEHAAYYMTCGEGMLDEALIKDFTAGAPEHIKWMGTKGVKFTAVYGNCHVPYAEKAGLLVDRIHVPEGPNGGAAGGGAILTKAFYEAATSKGAEFEFSAEVTKLITDGSNGVIGVEANVAGETLKIKALKGVVIATGGIDHSEDLAKQICPQQYWDLTVEKQCLSAPTNTGDGIRMGMEINAALEAVGGTIDFCGKTGIGTTNASPGLPCVFVNAAGRRFVCEDSTYAYHFRAIYQQEKQLGGPTYMVFDKKIEAFAGNPFAKDMGDAKVLAKANTLAELAKKIGVPAGNLEDTIAQWNKDMAGGKDNQYGRNTQLVPLDKGPYYAYQNKAMNLGSLGGLKINTDAQVIGMDGKPIPHLFAGGLATGGWVGPYYPGSGTAVMGTVHWGRKAGGNAAKATPAA